MRPGCLAKGEEVAESHIPPALAPAGHGGLRGVLSSVATCTPHQGCISQRASASEDAEPFSDCVCPRRSTRARLHLFRRPGRRSPRLSTKMSELGGPPRRMSYNFAPNSCISEEEGHHRMKTEFVGYVAAENKPPPPSAGSSMEMPICSPCGLCALHSLLGHCEHALVDGWISYKHVCERRCNVSDCLWTSSPMPLLSWTRRCPTMPSPTLLCKSARWEKERMAGTQMVVPLCFMLA